MIFNNESEFDEMHSKICGNSQFVVISGQYDAEEVECPYCGARYVPQQTWFNSEANPQFDEEGRKTGSGEYQEVEFEGYIPDEVLDG